jgi:chromosome segregation ATPase
MSDEPARLDDRRTGLERVDIIGRLTLEAVLEAGDELAAARRAVTQLRNELEEKRRQRDSALDTLEQLRLERDTLRAATVRLEHDLTVARALLDKELEQRPQPLWGGP